MAGFLRRKPTKEPMNPIQIPDRPVQLPEEPSTPVYTRFAKSSPQDAPESPKRIFISSPEPLSPKRAPPAPASQSTERNRSPTVGGSSRPLAGASGTQDLPAFRPIKTIPLQMRDKPLPPPGPPSEDDPLTAPPPPSNLPPSRRASASSQFQVNGSTSFLPNTHVATSNRTPTLTAAGKPPLQHNDSRSDRRRSTAPPSAQAPSNNSQTSLATAKEGLFSRLKKSAVPPSAFSRPTTAPPSSSKPLFRKSSVQDIPNKTPDSARLRSSSRYSLAEDGRSRQLSANHPQLQSNFHSNQGGQPSHSDVSGVKKRMSQNVVGHQQQQQQQQQERHPLPNGRDPVRRVVSRKDNHPPLPQPSPSLSPENLKGPQNGIRQSQSQYHINNMEFMRPPHPPHQLNGFSQPPQPQFNNVDLGRPPPPPHHFNSFPPQTAHSQQQPSSPAPSSQSVPNGPARGKPLIFAATATMDENAHVATLSPFQQSQQLSDASRYPQPPYHPPPRQPHHQNAGPALSSPSSPPRHAQSPIPLSQSVPALIPTPPPAPEPLFVQPQTPPRQKKPRSPSVSTSPESHHHKTLIKPRPVTPSSPAPSVKKFTPDSSGFELAAPVGIPLDEDPFAKPDGVRMLKPSSPSSRDLSSTESTPGQPRTRQGSGASSSTATEEIPDINADPHLATLPPPLPGSPPSSPEDYRKARSKRRGEGLERAPPPLLVNVPVRIDRPAEPFPLDLFLADANLLGTLLAFLTFYDWCVLSSISKRIRLVLIQNRALTEAILERYLKTVGYSHWTWSDPDPLQLSLMDLHDYMRGVSVPTYEYARVAELYAPALTLHPTQRDPILLENVRQLTAASRAYTRVVLRLRAQAEKEASLSSSTTSHRSPSVRPNGYASRASPSRSGSRPPSPTASSFSHSNPSLPRPPTPVSGFRSPLYRLRRAPLLRVFVPSPDSDWLSDASVLECEAELKRAGVQHMLRAGDVVWDVAVGDEGNVGRLVWDGSYLIDLDYSYSAVGDLPKYLPTLAFPPSYFHKVIRTGPGAGNPLIRLDISPWGPEIAGNLQLLQDRVRTETPQGNIHNVVRWVHRSTFLIRPPPAAVQRRQSTKGRPASPRIPIPDSPLFIDAAWYGTVVIETEGTNECLADLQDRCGPGAFPPRAMPVVAAQRDRDSKLVFRILRERSRPGEIWIRTVGPKERLL